jgi:hypothetical protein
MKIAEKKDEILKLIEKLNPEKDRPEDGKPGPAKRAGSLRDRLSRRRKELVQLSEKREKLDVSLLEERMLRTCQVLEERIARIEELISQEESHGTDFAPENLLMDAAPNTDIPSTKVVSPAIEAKTSATAPAMNSMYSLAGQIQEGVISDVLQLISSNQKSVIFTLDSEGKKVDLHFREGHCFHAECEELSGQSAFFAAMAIESGAFLFDEKAQLSDQKTIDDNTQFMILEALRQIDEERAKK